MNNRCYVMGTYRCYVLDLASNRADHHRNDAACRDSRVLMTRIWQEVPSLSMYRSGHAACYVDGIGILLTGGHNEKMEMLMECDMENHFRLCVHGDGKYGGRSNEAVVCDGTVCGAKWRTMTWRLPRAMSNHTLTV